MKRIVFLLPIALLVGCQSGDDGIDQQAVENAQAPLVSAAKKSGGDWSKMSSEERKLFLDRARGNETAAKQMAGMMAGGPPGGGPRR